MYKEPHIKQCICCGKSFTTYSQKKKCCSKICTKRLWREYLKETGHNKGTLAGRKIGITPWNKNKCCPQLCGKNNGFYGKNHTEETKAKIRKASYNTKKLNNSFNISKEEQLVGKMLKERFKDVKAQYKSEKYPFACDFYIPELDLYIECNFHWTHGIHNHIVYGVFDSNNPKHIALLKYWQSKHTKYFDRAIKTWTELDVKKQQFADLNSLNYFKFYKLNEFIEWYNNLHC